MAYRTILAHLSSTGTGEQLMDVAMKLAGSHEAHLIGLYVVPQYRINLLTGYEATPEVLNRFRNDHLGLANKLAKKFETLRSNNAVSGEWRTVDATRSEIAPTICEHGLMADLIITDKDTQTAREWLDDGLAECIALQSGRPVLQIPAKAQAKPLGRDVLLAWNGGREATRAAFDALPVLCRAENVRLHIVDPPKDSAEQLMRRGTELAAALSRHNVNVTVSQSASGQQSVGKELLEQTRKTASDLIVLGAYGHWRIPEFILGGVTRHILRHAEVPVLMTH